MEPVDINILIKIKEDGYQDLEKKEVDFGLGLQRLWQNNGHRKKYKTKMVSKSLYGVISGQCLSIKSTT